MGRCRSPGVPGYHWRSPKQIPPTGSPALGQCVWNLVTWSEMAVRVDLDHILLSGSVKVSVFLRKGRKKLLMQCYLNFGVIIKI